MFPMPDASFTFKIEDLTSIHIDIYALKCSNMKYIYTCEELWKITVSIKTKRS